MKTSFVWGLPPLFLGACLLPWAASAQTTTYTGTGWVSQVLAPGILCPAAAGPMLLRASVQILRVECSDPRLAGRRTVLTDASQQADGSFACYGAAYHEVGTWDAAGVKFTPTGGLWEMTWRGAMPTNNSMQATQAGYGSGATIDRFRMAENISRPAAASVYDPTVPILYTGTIQPPPLTTNLVTDSFTSQLQGWTFWGNPAGIAYYVTNQQLLTRANWTGVLPQGVPSMFLLRCPTRNWSLADGQTIEARVDLVRISEESTNSARLYLGSDAAAYEFGLGNNGAYLMHWLWGGSSYTFPWQDAGFRSPRSGVTLSLSLTRDQQNAIVVSRVLDTATTRVLYERSFVEAPGATTPVFTGTGGGLGLFQWQNLDGSQAPVEAVFDNLVLRVSDVPPLSITSAVQLSWPAPTGGNYSVETAPTVQGPWAPLPTREQPGLQTRAVPAGLPAQFFRLRPAP